MCDYCPFFFHLISLFYYPKQTEIEMSSFLRGRNWFNLVIFNVCNSLKTTFCECRRKEHGQIRCLKENWKATTKEIPIFQTPPSLALELTMTLLHPSCSMPQGLSA